MLTKNVYYLFIFTVSVGGSVAFRFSTAATTLSASLRNAAPDTLLAMATGSPLSPLAQMLATSGICPSSSTPISSARRLHPSLPKM